MFTLEPAPTFWASVRLTVPGQPEPAALEVEFAHKSTDALRAWIDAAKTNPISDASTLAEIVCGWRGVDVPFSAQALDTLLRNYPAAAAELFEQYLRALTESRLKN